NTTVIITTKELPIEIFALELTINSNFSDSLKNESSNDYIEFKNKLQNYTLGGFEKTGQIDIVRAWKIESLRPGSIIALTSIGIAQKPGSNAQEIVVNAIKNGDTNIVPVNKDKILIKSITQSSTKSITNTTTSKTSKKDDDEKSVSAVAIAIPIVVGVFVIIIIIVAFCLIRRKRRARNSYILQTAAERMRTSYANPRSEIPSTPPGQDKTSDLSSKSVSNISNIRFKPLNDPPPKISTLEPVRKRDSSPPTYSMTDFYSSSVENLKNIGINDNNTNNNSIKKKNDKIELKDLNFQGARSPVNRADSVLYNDTSDMDSIAPNFNNIIKKSNNPLFQIDDE
ncbi:unnamed protein product, partial [Brachionus calyciflorus]